MVRLTVLLVFLAVVAGCDAAPDNAVRRAAAARVANEFLRAVSGGEPDYGWSLLQPQTREQWGSYERYAAAVEAADWSVFEFTVLETTYCDDGIFCRVALAIPGGPESVPPLLDGKDGVVFRGEDVRLPGDAEIFVVLSDLFRASGGVGPGPQP